MGPAGQGGNVYEWEETALDLVNDSSSSVRGRRGGGWSSFSEFLSSSVRTSNGPTGDDFDRGFRVASIPEPSTLLLAALAGTAPLWRRRLNERSGRRER